MPYLSRKGIEEIAQRAVAAYKKLPVFKGKQLRRVEPEIFVRDLLGLTIEYHSLSPDGSILGATSCGQIGIPIFDDPTSPDYCFLDGKTVLIERALVSEGANRGRYNFSLMHEASHQILGMISAGSFKRNASGDRIRYYAEIRSPEDDYWEEWRANTLASAILMPAEMVCANLKEFGLGERVQVLNGTFAPKEYAYFCEMAEYMGVSHQALSIRLSQLGLLEKTFGRSLPAS